MNDKRALFLAAAMAFSACGKGDTCVPGATSACACPGGDTGAQTCLDDDTFGACMCLSGTGGSGGGSASSGGGSGNTGGGSGGGTMLGTHKRVFVTSTQFNGLMGGLSGVDANCNMAAQAANLGGTWVAWASDSLHDAIDRVNDVGPWYLLDGTTKAFNNKANLGTTALASIHINEQGTNVAGNAPAVWTGTAQAGHFSKACEDWTVAVDYEGGVMGNAGGTSDWTNLNSNAACSDMGALYCIEQ